jgi:hypothetical protein
MNTICPSRQRTPVLVATSSPGASVQALAAPAILECTPIYPGADSSLVTRRLRNQVSACVSGSGLRPNLRNMVSRRCRGKYSIIIKKTPWKFRPGCRTDKGLGCGSGISCLARLFADCVNSGFSGRIRAPWQSRFRTYTQFRLKPPRFDKGLKRHEPICVMDRQRRVAV